VDQARALEQATPFLFVGNNRYQTSGPGIGTRPKLDSGRLWVCMAPSSGGRHVVRTALKALLRRGTDEDLHAFETEEIWIEPGTPRVNVSTDGEVSVMKAPLDFRIRPHALAVIVPERRISPSRR
jgi:diacylglycerol kinase family enzyme